MEKLGSTVCFYVGGEKKKKTILCAPLISLSLCGALAGVGCLGEIQDFYGVFASA